MQQETQHNHTPKKPTFMPCTPTKPPLYSKANQSTQIHSPMQEFCSPSFNPWKTPKSLLKSAHKQTTPDTTQHHQVSPYSDRYIPFRQDSVSRNLFNKPIQPFEIEEENVYNELLTENLLCSDENNKHTFSKKFDTPKIKQDQSRRKIDTQPYKVLDAPGLDDDFYQDTLHWGKNNLVAVGLQRSVYLYNVENGKVFKMADAQTINDDQAYYTSLQWNTNGNTLALGCYDGQVMLWDLQKQTFQAKIQLSQKRISSISWANNNVFAYGCKDKNVVVADSRVPTYGIHCLQGHTQEVCGVTFDGSENQLASGGNDNKVMIWQLRGGPEDNKYVSWEIKSHKAAVRALAWSPHASGIIATGGGNKDQTIKIHSTLTNQQIHNSQVDSQVCKLRFSKSVNELVSTHGYEKNQVCVWSYPHLKKIHQLEGHSDRVLYLSISPDEQTILTGSGDETLKFWKVFPNITSNNSSALFQICDIR